jgi:hypothetical protein
LELDNMKIPEYYLKGDDEIFRSELERSAAESYQSQAPARTLQPAPQTGYSPELQQTILQNLESGVIKNTPYSLRAPSVETPVAKKESPKTSAEQSETPAEGQGQQQIPYNLQAPQAPAMFPLDVVSKAKEIYNRMERKFDEHNYNILAQLPHQERESAMKMLESRKKSYLAKYDPSNLKQVYNEDLVKISAERSDKDIRAIHKSASDLKDLISLIDNGPKEGQSETEWRADVSKFINARAKQINSAFSNTSDALAVPEAARINPFLSSSYVDLSAITDPSRKAFSPVDLQKTRELLAGIYNGVVQNGIVVYNSLARKTSPEVAKQYVPYDDFSIDLKGGTYSGIQPITRETPFVTSTNTKSKSVVMTYDPRTNSVYKRP